MSHEENSEILVADGDDNHVPVINIYELLINSEPIELETDRDDWIIYLLSRYDIMFTLFKLMLKDNLFCLLKKRVFISSLFFVLQ